MTHSFLKDYRFANGLTVRNRVVMSPMTTMTSFYNGMVTSDEVNYYAARAGGPGLVITGVANVTALGKGFEGELSVASDDMIPGLSRVATAIKQGGARAILQIFHAGRKSTRQILRGEQPVAPSAIAASYPADSQEPRAMTKAEIQTTITAFGAATRRAIQAGFDGVELHGANTYLLQQFFSPNANQRQDEWGGDRDDRMRFANAVLASVHEAVDQYAHRPFLVGYRLSPEEIETPSIRLADSLYFAQQIRDRIDYLHLSMGSYQRTSLNDKTDPRPLLGQFVDAVAGQVPVIGIGSVEQPRDADAVLAGGATFVAMGRELLREPEWVQKVLAGDEASIRTQLSPVDLTELAIPPVMQVYLQTAFKPVMHFTTDPAAASDYRDQLAPMEGFEKKL